MHCSRGSNPTQMDFTGGGEVQRDLGRLGSQYIRGGLVNAQRGWYTEKKTEASNEPGKKQ